MKMSTSVRNSDRILRSFPLVASPFKKVWWGLGHKYLHHSGSEWALDRMKSMVTHVLYCRSKGVWTHPSWWARQYVNYIKRITLTGSDAQFVQLVQTLRSWTLFLGASRKLHEKDVDKFRDQVSRVEAIWSKSLLKAFPDTPEDSARRRNVYESFPPLNSHVKPVQPVLFRTEEFENAMSALNYADFNGWWLPDWMVRFRVEIDQDYGLGWPFGYIDYRIQSDGKVRWFYAAPPWQNEMFVQYSKTLYQVLRGIDEDCTFDQERGVRIVHRWIAQGKPCHSIDLSSATDAFPWGVTKRFLNSASGHAASWNVFTKLYESLVLKPGGMIRTSLAGMTPHVEWNVGQPLGSQPSFAMFALSHHFLVRLAFANAGIPHANKYVLLGDDIVIRHTKAAKEYRKLLHTLRVPISEDKSLSSTRLAEFAGRVISKKSFGFKLKAFRVIPENLHSAISILGARAVRSCRQSFARDVMALIPQRGYKGTNPGGFPSDKVQVFYDWLFSQPDEDHSDLSEDMYATRTQVASRCAALQWHREWDPMEVSRDLPTHRFHDDPVTGVVWKWKPFMRRRVYSRIIRKARQIFE